MDKEARAIKQTSRQARAHAGAHARSQRQTNNERAHFDTSRRAKGGQAIKRAGNKNARKLASNQARVQVRTHAGAQRHEKHRLVNLNTSRHGSMANKQVSRDKHTGRQTAHTQTQTRKPVSTDTQNARVHARAYARSLEREGNGRMNL